NLAPQQPAGQSPVPLPVVRVREVGQRTLKQLALTVAEHLAERPVAPVQAIVEAEDRHAYRGVRERKIELPLAPRRQLTRPHVGGRLTEWGGAESGSLSATLPFSFHKKDPRGKKNKH